MKPSTPSVLKTATRNERKERQEVLKRAWLRRCRIVLLDMIRGADFSFFKIYFDNELKLVFGLH